MGRRGQSAELFYSLKKNPCSDLCHVSYCRNPKSNGILCCKHYQRMWRANNKLIASYRALRDHASYRGIEFALSFDKFSKMAEKTSYLDNKGTTRYALQVDRIDACRGYVDDNVRIVTTSENAAKSNKERYLPEHVQHMLRRKRSEDVDEPF